MFSDDESTSTQTKTRMIHAHHLSLIVFYLKHIFSHTPELVQIYERSFYFQFWGKKFPLWRLDK